MKTPQEIMDNPKLTVRESAPDGGRGYLKLGQSFADSATVVWSWGGGWDHVSISYPNRCPTWEEMCKAKDVFFREDECCIEYHPARENYVNFHPYCLHIWKPQNMEIPVPPICYV